MIPTSWKPTGRLLPRRVIGCLLLILNSGWIIPAYLCGHSLISWCQLEASPVIHENRRVDNSFPFLAFSRQMLTVASIWIAIAIVWNTFRANKPTKDIEAE
jgi:hypothetical protein